MCSLSTERTPTCRKTRETEGKHARVSSALNARLLDVVRIPSAGSSATSPVTLHCCLSPRDGRQTVSARRNDQSMCYRSVPGQTGSQILALREHTTGSGQPTHFTRYIVIHWFETVHTTRLQLWAVGASSLHLQQLEELFQHRSIEPC